MHIVCLYQHYNSPDCAASARLYTMLQHLSQRHKVTLVTSTIWHRQRITDYFPWAPEGVDVRMIDVPYSNAMSALQRLRSYTSFPMRALREGLRAVSPDVVYGISTPLTTGWAAARLARRRDIPWVFEIRDLWPDFPIQMGAVPTAVLRKRLYRLEHDLYESAAHVVTMSPDMTDHVVDLGVSESKVTTLLQGTNFEFIDNGDTQVGEGPGVAFGVDTQSYMDRQHVVLYAGTFGRANDIPTLLAAAERLRHRDDIGFVFTGQGFHETDIRAAAKKNPGVVLAPPAARHSVFSWFKRARVSIVSFIDKPVLATNSPAKLFDSLACGTPVIVTNPGWTKQLVESHGCGLFAPAGDVAALTQSIVSMIDDDEMHEASSRNGMELARSRFDRRTMSVRLEEILQEVTQNAASYA